VDWGDRLVHRLGYGLPIICAGVNAGITNTPQRRHVINVINGGMSDTNIHYGDFKALFDENLAYSDINVTPNNNPIIVDDDTPFTVSAENVTGNSGYINMYSDAPNIIKVVNNDRGENVSSTIKALKDGCGNLIIANGTCTKKIPIFRAPKGVWLLADSDDANMSISDNGYKATLFMLNGDGNADWNVIEYERYRFGDRGFFGGFYVPQIPNGATKLIVNVVENSDALFYLKVYNENKQKVYNTNGWKDSIELDIAEGYKYFTLAVKQANQKALRANNVVNDLFTQVTSAVNYEFE
jgi:hypothetical protein